MRIIALAVALAATIAAPEFEPARRVSGALPQLPPPNTVGWLDETVALTIDAGGRVQDVGVLQASKPQFLAPAAATWLFRPATENRVPVPSRVLAVTAFRPPQLYDGPTLGEPPTERAPAPDEVPLPTVTLKPRYPPRALTDGVVLVEVLVGIDGRVTDASVMEGAPGFNEEALITARQWVFRPARRHGELVTAYAYVVFGFRRPVV